MADGGTETKPTWRRTIKCSALSLGIFLSIAFLGCATDTNPSASEEINSEQEQAENRVENPAATEEYLMSLPLGERMRAQILLDEKERIALRLNAQEQLTQWIEEASPRCADYFGTSGCHPVVIELEESERCPFSWSRYATKPNDIEETGHYYVSLRNKGGDLAGGFHWIASFNHQAYVDGYVLNITKCWNKYPEEMEMDNP